MSNSDLFDTNSHFKNKKLNKLPMNPEQKLSEKAVGPGRFPSWLHRSLPKGSSLKETSSIINKNRLHTVCEEAKCPNLLECWSKKTATFLVMGKECTRNCGFCDIDFTKTPKPLDIDEADRVVDSVKELGLKHVVITMVARDDLLDGGASHLEKIILNLRQKVKDISIEILTSDFSGNENSLSIVLEAKPDIFNHNIETVKRLSPFVRHKATYERTLSVLRYAKEFRKNPYMKVKSGLMVGLGEEEDEVLEAIHDMYSAGCDIITIGQYLQASSKKLLVKSFVNPDQFKKFEEYGLSIGVKNMYCGPFVRSSYNAHLFHTNVVSNE